MKHLLLASVAAVTLATSRLASAMEGARPAYTPPPVTVNSGSIAQIIFSLLLVLAAIVAVSWLLKRMNLTQQGAGNLLKVIGSVAVGQRERVVLVEINDTWLVVGVGPGQIHTLHTLEKNAELTAGQTAQPDNTFARMLAPLVGRRGQTGEGKNAS